MPLAQSLSEYIRACFTGLWIESHEHQDALAEIAGLCRCESWQLVTGDIDRGLDVGGNEPTNNSAQDPLSAIRALSSLASADGTAILVLQNFHRVLQSAEIVQALARQIINGKALASDVFCWAVAIIGPASGKSMF